MEFKDIKFSNVLKRGITTIREVNGKTYEVHYTYGKLSDNDKLADYGIVFIVNINDKDYGLFIPVDESLVDNQYTDSVIKEAVETFKDSFRFTFKNLRK